MLSCWLMNLAEGHTILLAFLTFISFLNKNWVMEKLFIMLCYWKRTTWLSYEHWTWLNTEKTKGSWFKNKFIHLNCTKKRERSIEKLISQPMFSHVCTGEQGGSKSERKKNKTYSGYYFQQDKNYIKWISSQE